MACTRRKALALTVLAVVLAGCGSSHDQGDGARVEGVVRDSATGKGVHGASVKFVSDVLDEADTKTGDHGGYELFVESQTPHGHLTVEKDGYEPRTVSVYLDDSDVHIDVDLTPKS